MTGEGGTTLAACATFTRPLDARKATLKLVQQISQATVPTLPISILLLPSNVSVSDPRLTKTEEDKESSVRSLNKVKHSAKYVQTTTVIRTS